MTFSFYLALYATLFLVIFTFYTNKNNIVLLMSDVITIGLWGNYLFDDYLIGLFISVVTFSLIYLYGVLLIYFPALRKNKCISNNSTQNVDNCTIQANMNTDCIHRGRTGSVIMIVTNSSFLGRFDSDNSDIVFKSDDKLEVGNKFVILGMEGPNFIGRRIVEEQNNI